MLISPTGKGLESCSVDDNSPDYKLIGHRWQTTDVKLPEPLPGRLAPTHGRCSNAISFNNNQEIFSL
tara:strand:- start:8884 stop:9084 length:201 start_codon:yes stop_codon:yes gene_type:complete